MTNPVDNEDNFPPRPRWIAWAIGVLMLVVVFGMVNIAWMMLTGRLGPSDKGEASTAQTATDPSVVRAPQPGGMGQCMSCHSVERRYTGPSFVDIGKRYHGRPDAQAYLASRIRNGSVGEWGRVIMPRQSSVTEEDANRMAVWLLSLAPAASAAAAPATEAAPAPAPAPAASQP